LDRLLTLSSDSKYNLGKQEVRLEFLHLPDCPVALMGRDLCKLRAQITFHSDGIAALKLRGPEAKILTLMAVQEEEWGLSVPKREIPEMPELPFKIPEVWAEDNLLSQTGLEHTSSGGRIKAGSHSC
jgi:hypothetical protein